jgi:hypothetical protein
MLTTILIALIAVAGLLAVPETPAAAAAAPPADVAPPAGSIPAPLTPPAGSPPALGDLSSVPLITGFS